MTNYMGAAKTEHGITDDFSGWTLKFRREAKFLASLKIWR